MKSVALRSLSEENVMYRTVWTGAFSLLWLALLVSTAEAQRGAGSRSGLGDLRTPDKLVPSDFTLKKMDGDEEVTLSQFQGKRPVALIFGSYT